MQHPDMINKFNEQINAELYSAYLYLAMAAHFENINFKGMAHWMELQAQEEVGHAMRLYRHMHERRWEVKLMAMEAPQAKWATPLAAFEAAFAHEQLITGKINHLMELAVTSKDYAAQSFLQWFVDEQVEEESSVDEIVQKLHLISKSPEMLLLLDSELGERNKSA